MSPRWAASLAIAAASMVCRPALLRIPFVLAFALSNAASSPAAASSPVAAKPADGGAEDASKADPKLPTGRTRPLPACSPTRRFGCCASPDGPCYRSRPARWGLLAGAVLAGGGSAALVFGLGDRLAGGDPGAGLLGTSAVASIGALIGVVAGLLGADGPGDPDRVTPSALGMEFGWVPEGELDEHAAPSLSGLFAPTLRLGHDHGRLRLFGRVGGTLGTSRDVDPRPQFGDALEGRSSTAPEALRQRSLAIDLGLDLAVALPYPVLPPDRAVYWGRFEIRYQPKVHIRRDALWLAGSERTLERVMFLPLNVGFRWYFAPRQRITFYTGPRIDFVNVGAGEGALQRAPAQFGPFYAEAWYDLDVPFSRRPRRDGRPRRARVNGLFTLGYVHSRFDGNGFNFGAVFGFLGPIHISWLMRVRPRDAAVAWQFGVRAAVGINTTVLGQAGVVLPDIRRKRK